MNKSINNHLDQSSQVIIGILYYVINISHILVCHRSLVRHDIWGAKNI